MDVKLIRAFIASPGGLEAERKAAFSAAEEVNRSVARPLSGRLELIGWEETLSGIGRPQALINADMETCDLFIGAMWSSWGSRPSSDGPYTSGFEEEFERSRERYARTRSPIMAMFFKDVDPRQLRDPGDELKKVLRFQEKLRSEQEFLYNRFGTHEEFAARVREFLSTHVVQTLKRTSILPAERPVQSQRTGALSSPQPVTGPMQTDAPEAAFLEQCSQSFRNEDGPSPAEVARLRLVATSAGTAGNDKQLVGVHDANLLYTYRSEFSFSLNEKRSLLCCGLAELEGENVPVWSWLAELNRQRPRLLGALTVMGEEAERVGALTVIRLLGEPIESFHTLDGGLQNSWFRSNTPAAVKVAALRYLRDFGRRSELQLVEQEVKIAANETVSGAIEAAVAILLRDNEADAVRYLLSVSFETLALDVVYGALAKLDEFSSEELAQGLDHRSPEVRSRALTTLSERNAVGIETIGRALVDDAPIVRLAAVRALDRLGQPLSLDEASTTLSRPKGGLAGIASIWGDASSTDDTLFESYRPERLSGMGVQALEALLGAPNHHDAAYRELAKRRIGDFASRLRADLEDGFCNYFANHRPLSVRPSQLGLVAALGLGSADPDEYSKRELISLALAVVATQRDKTDLLLIRSVLDKHAISPTSTVIAYLKALGSREDVARLARTPRYSWLGYGDYNLERTFDAAAEAILKLAGDDVGALATLVTPNIMRARLIDLVSPREFAKLDDKFITNLLLDDDATVRRAAAKKVPASLIRSRIAKVLSAYKANEKGGYYVVTHWLDLGLAYPRSRSKEVTSKRR